jgi:hypothetical protein
MSEGCIAHRARRDATKTTFVDLLCSLASYPHVRSSNMSSHIFKAFIPNLPQQRCSKMLCIAGPPYQPHQPQSPIHVHISLVAQHALHKSTFRPRTVLFVRAASRRGAACSTWRDLSVESRKLGCKSLRLVVR